MSAALLFLFATSLFAEPVLLGQVRREKNLPDNLEKLALALEQDFSTVLQSLGAEVVLESKLTQSPELQAVDFRSCADSACVERVLKITGQKTAVIPFLERTRNSENLNVRVFRIQEGKVTEESLVILFVNIERTKRRQALETVLVQSFPRRSDQNRNAPEDLTQKQQTQDPPKEEVRKESEPAKQLTPAKAVIRVVTDPGGADVFVDGRLAGQSPLEIESTGEMRTLRITKPGFVDASMPVRTSGRLEIIVTLIPNNRPASESTDSSRQQQAQMQTQTFTGSYPYWGAFARSLLLPGLGQYHKGDTGKALLFGAGAFGAAGLSLYNSNEERRRLGQVREYYRQSGAFLFVGTTSTVVSQYGLLQYILHGERDYLNLVISSCNSKACNGYLAARRNTRLSLYTLGGVYIWNALDALFSGGPSSSSGNAGSFSWAAAPVMDTDRGFVLAARVRF